MRVVVIVVAVVAVAMTAGFIGGSAYYARRLFGAAGVPE